MSGEPGELHYRAGAEIAEGPGADRPVATGRDGAQVTRVYELGNGLSDTRGRICCAYRHDDKDERATWPNVFRAAASSLKRLLDYVSSRLNASGVTVMRPQLDHLAARGAHPAQG